MEKKELTINEKLIKAINDCKTPKKTATMKYGNVNHEYAPLSEVIQVVKQSLAKQGLCLLQGITSKTIGDIPTYELLTRVSDGIDIVTLDSRPINFTGTPQQLGSIETYYRRYALNSVFSLGGEVDLDGNSHEMPFQDKDLINELRTTYITAIKSGVDKTELDEIRKSFGKDVNNLNNEELTYIINVYKESIKSAKGV